MAGVLPFGVCCLALVVIVGVGGVVGGNYNELKVCKANGKTF